PFVGMFIARVSRGRTIRQFIIGVVIAPTLLISIWFAVFGSTAGYVQNSGTDLTQYATELVVFNMFDQLPLSIPLSIIALLLLMIFFLHLSSLTSFILGVQSTSGFLLPSNSGKHRTRFSLVCYCTDFTLCWRTDCITKHANRDCSPIFYCDDFNDDFISQNTS